VAGEERQDSEEQVNAGRVEVRQERNETERKGGSDKALQCRHNVLNFFFLKCTTTFTKKQLSSKEA
jgi:hypothetical protein